jgi:hypothetical protein
MTNLQLEKLKKCLVLRVLFGASPEILAKLPNAQDYLTGLDAAIQEIQTYRDQQLEGNETIPEQRKQMKAKLVAELIEIERRLQSYGTRNNDNLLLNATKLSKTDLNRLDDVKLVEYSKSIYNKVNNLLDKLVRYELDADTQKVLIDEITEFEILSPQVSKSKFDQKDVTTYLAQAYKKADDILGRLDKDVEIIRSSQPIFYANYKTTRRVDMPTDVIQLVAKVTDATTGAGIPNATATIAPDGGTAEPIVKQTAGKGGFQIKTLPSGIYTVTVVKLGYLTQTISIIITGDEPYALNVKLVKA